MTDSKKPIPKPKKDNRKVIAKTSLVVLGVLLLACSFWAVNIINEMNWPKAKAVIEKTEQSDEYGDYKYVYVSYKYLVKEQAYLSKELIGQFQNPKLSEVIEKYKHGTEVDIAYNPANPKVCALSSDNNPTVLNIVLAIWGFLFILSAFDIWLIRYKLPR